MSTIVYCVVGILLAYLLYEIYMQYFRFNTREGVVFTPYDNRKLFTRPWNQFCLVSPAACNPNPQVAPATGFSHMNRPGTTQVGCWCNADGTAPELETPCYDMVFDEFPTVRR